MKAAKAVEMRTNGPSAHLSLAELVCRDASRTAYPIEWWEDRLILLAAEFEAVRAMAGHQPIAVLSAYRTPAHNRTVGGARRSQHLEGRALDLRPPRGMPLRRFHDLILTCAAHPGSRIRGVGFYHKQGFVHLDIRPAPRLVRWQGSQRRTGDLT